MSKNFYENPYLVGLDVGNRPDKFIGRENILNEVVQLINGWTKSAVVF